MLTMKMNVNDFSFFEGERKGDVVVYFYEWEERRVGCCVGVWRWEGWQGYEE